MLATSKQSGSELREALRGYLAEHPDAADDLIGIRLWWLPTHLRDVPLEQLHAALIDLIALGEMRCTEMLGGTELYARNELERDTDEEPKHS